ncbi:tRNA 2-thiocytidine biosynthesis protein ttcA [Trichostrongylus colubriformis]|uniref:tRNA 2-thiocytidine biosynthesis protein ttcA n=1 Tax=Trichostrongylus colubriformis TaxID=6319 RepID=A0AAN8FSZ7_TRICO
MMQRRFGERIPEIEAKDSLRDSTSTSGNLIPWIRENEIGKDTAIETPFGKRQAIYCDYTASARAIRPIEDYIMEHVLPLYGNTHSSVTVTSEQTTLFVHEARQEIRAMTGAGDGDSVIFVGSGSTAAVELLIHLMQPQNLVVILSVHEHHSNTLPWRAVAEACYYVRESGNGGFDLVDLVRVLDEARGTHPHSQLLAAFTACSNITGICMDVPRISAVLRKYNALSVWDYASSAPYVNINVNGTHPVDAIFFSGHKFVGGVSSPGVLVVKKSLLKATAPKRIGGGTVFFVSSSGEWYLKDAEYREEGGTPDSVGIIRLALSVKLKRAVGEENIIALERQKSERFLSGLKGCSNVMLLGAPIVESRLAVFSFLMKDSPSGLFFHHNYVSALLNDLFGIQSRAGCMCAGPYAQYLMGISEELALQYLNALREADGLDRTHLRRVGEYSSHEMLRPGFTRVSIPYFWTDEQVDHLVECIRFVSERAADFIHLYQLNCESGEWHHHKQRTFHARKWLGHVTFTGNGMVVEERKRDMSAPLTSGASLAEAHRLAKESLAAMDKTVVPDGRSAVDDRYAHLRWFVLPIEVAERNKGVSVAYPTLPYQPRQYPEGAGSWQCPEGGEIREHPLSDGIFEHKVAEVELISDAITEDGKQVDDDEASNELDLESHCLPCTSADDGTVQCLLNPSDRGKGSLGEFGTDEEPENAKTLDDWDKRVVVRRRELTAADNSRIPWHQPPLEMYRRVSEAIHGLDMIKEGDKVLVCLSGGKDSLSLLHILHFYQMRCRKNKSTNFELGAITVDPGSTAYNPRPLIDYCRSLNIDYFYEEQDIIGAARKLNNVRSICAFCSRMKRGRLAAAAQLHGWNVLAMGQHLDDVAESFFIAAFQNGNLSTMKAQYKTRDGTLRVIRPLIFVRERALREFAESKGLPVVAENCPACFNQATERHRIKQLLAQQELIFPDLFNSLRSALRPLLLVDSARTDEMRALAIENIVKFNKGKAK